MRTGLFVVSLFSLAACSGHGGAADGIDAALAPDSQPDVALGNDAGDTGADPGIFGVRSAAIYEPAWTTASDGRGAPVLLGDMRAGFVARGAWKWSPPAANLLADVQSSVTAVRATNPAIIFEAGMTTAYLQKNGLGGDQWPDGTRVSDADINDMVVKSSGGASICHPTFCATGWLLDIAKNRTRTFLVEWGRAFIDRGVDAIFFDEVYTAALYRVQTFHDDPSTTATAYAGHFKAIVDDIRTYASSKMKRFYAARNGGILADVVSSYQQYPVLLQADDFVHGTFQYEDFVSPFVPLENFAQIKAAIVAAAGHALQFIMFVDWDSPKNPKSWLNRLAGLTVVDQDTVLRNLDAATKAAGIVFAYPAYGGETSAGKYDSVKVGTYDVIKELSLAR